MIFDRNYKVRTIYDWTINPIYTGCKYDCGENDCIIGEYKGEKFRTQKILRLESVTFDSIIVVAKNIDGGYGKYRLYFDEHFEPTFIKKKKIYNWEYNYINDDENFRFNIIGFIDKKLTRSWKTTPITLVETRKKYILVHTESGSVYKLYHNDCRLLHM